MTQEQMLEQIVKQVMSSMGTVTASASAGGALTDADYPIGEKRPELLKTPTGIAFSDLTVEKMISGELKSEDMRITPETLELQAQVAESVKRGAFARNLRRAAELIAVPDARLLEIYNLLRPYRCTKAELYAIADELQNKYGATINAAFVKEAADVYEVRKRLKGDN
ncbi:diol dehydratase small subunit [Acetobacterium bakii]|uniref:Propanediol dehydratase n=1 Tax=Acetobacterium bakii TaxID=52689 RepID=A0A0L6TYN0_9FIRM|nr:diol dehydratase small subunit [Acetobacterium bakii]KNZ41361.1 propanediol dehydratase [Acetobacterium bakii]